MTDEKQKTGVPPKYRGEGIAIWENQDKNGNAYLTVQMLGKNGIRVNCFEVKDKEK